MTSKNLRTFPSIPIFIVENHNEILEFIYRCLASRHLPFQNNKIIHFDSHPDMAVPRNMPAEFVYDKEKLFNAISIENWLMPTVFAGHISKLFWIKPSWSQQIKNGNYNFIIGRYNDNICVTSTLEYFVSEGSYRPEFDLSDKKPVQLIVKTLNDNNDQEIKNFDLENDLENDSFILDIDLDFFSTHNPFLNIFHIDNVYDQLKDIFYYKFPENIENDSESILNCAEKRVEQLNELEKLFKHLKQTSSIEKYEMPVILKNVWEKINILIKTIKENYNNPDWLLIYDAGCTCDSTDLPHHKSNENEMKILLNEFKIYLQNIVTLPIIITISRSSEDDYCPEDQVEWIQEQVLLVLRDVYGEKLSKDPIYRYKDL